MFRHKSKILKNIHERKTEPFLIGGFLFSLAFSQKAHIDY